jgi:hypothetical protein
VAYCYAVRLRENTGGDLCLNDPEVHASSVDTTAREAYWTKGQCTDSGQTGSSSSWPGGRERAFKCRGKRQLRDAREGCGASRDHDASPRGCAGSSFRWQRSH